MHHLRTTRPATRWVPLGLCGLALAAGVAGAAPAPPIGPVWAARYDDPEKANDAYDLVVDSAGNSYAISRSIVDRETDETEIRVVKYTTAGQRQWTSSYAPAGGVGFELRAAPDGSGNLLVAASTEDGDIAVVKLSAAGAQLWDTTYDGANSGPETVGDMVVDGAGDAYVAGTAGSIVDDSTDALLLKLAAANGDVLWEARSTGEVDTNQRGNGVALDPEGGVYLAGSTADETDIYDFLTVKFNAANGSELWSSTYDGPDGDNDIAIGIAVTPNGVAVTGSSEGTEGSDFATVRYNGADGAELWANRYDGPATGEDSLDQAHALAVDGSGNVYVTGVSSSGDSSVADYATVKYDGATGSQTWVSRYDGPGAEDEFDFRVDTPYDLQVDAGGDVYVTGEVLASGLHFDLGTVKYNAAGQQQWVHLYNARGLDDLGRKLGLDGAGNVYVTGTSTTRENEKTLEPEYGIVVLKYLPSGRGVAGPRTARSTFTFTESARDKLACFREEGETFCDEVTSSTFRVNSTATLQNIDTAAFDEETTFSLSVGGLQIEKILGDDEQYSPGKTSATFTETVLDDDDREHKALTIQVSWRRGKLQVSVASTPFFDGGILAGDFLDQETGRITESTTAAVSLGDFTQEFDVAVTGRVTSRPTRDEAFTISRVTLSGKGTAL